LTPIIYSHFFGSAAKREKENKGRAATLPLNDANNFLSKRVYAQLGIIY